MATNKNEDPRQTGLRAGIVESTLLALSAALQARRDPSLGDGMELVAQGWEAVSEALMQSRTPDPEDPGSVAEWAFRKPVVQAMTDAVKAAEASFRSGGGADTGGNLQARLAELKAKLASRNSVASEISFSERLARDNFDARTASLKARAERPLAEFAAGAAAAKARQARNAPE